MRDIEQFALERLGIMLSKKQLEIIDAAVQGKKLFLSRKAGYSTAMMVLRKYIGFSGDYVKHFKNVHYRGITIDGQKFLYCPVGVICSWSEGDVKNKWCHYCKKYFSEIKEGKK